ncbi:MAG: alpha-amylase family protein, partial [Caulobacteraceae bacterium]
MKRIVHVNFNEHDPEGFDVEAWADYLASAKAQATYLSVTNVVAFYPTKLDGLPVSPVLKGRDLFGECAQAARARGIRVIGRFSIDIAKSALATEHPDWFCRTRDGALVKRSLVGAPDDPSASSEYAPTCQFTDYYTRFVPALFDEVLRRYPVDGLYTNGWPGWEVVKCHCRQCQAIGDPDSAAYRAAYEARAVALWRMYAKQIAGHDPRLIFTGNLGGGFKGGDLDLGQLTREAPWYQADNQGRGGIGAPAWDASQQTRIGRALAGGRPVTNITAGYEISGDIRWRNVTGNPAEVRSRLYQTLAAGGVIHYHWLGYHQGFVEDRRWQAVGREVLAWQAANDAHFHNVRSLASVALVVSQRSNRLYRAPPGTDALDAVQGMYQLLTEARIPFDVILESDLTPATLSRYRALVLPNVALMSDGQAQAVLAFARSGGSVLATFETGLYDEKGTARPDFALGELFGVRRTGARESYGAQATEGHGAFPGSSSIQRIERPHPLTAGFRDTQWIQGSSCRMPITAEGPPILTHVAQYPWYPTEAVYSRQPHTDQPTMAAREAGGARLVYFAGDLDAGYWRSGAGDLGDLVSAGLTWAAGSRPPLEVVGDGLVEVGGWETEPGYAIHLVNHTSPGFRATAARGIS